MLRRKKPDETPAAEEQAPVSFLVVDIRVPDDGHSLTGRRYAGFVREIEERQMMSVAQDEVTIWLKRLNEQFVSGTPRINGEDLEILNDEKVLGAVRTVDGQLRYFPF